MASKAYYTQKRDGSDFDITAILASAYREAAAGDLVWIHYHPYGRLCRVECGKIHNGNGQ